MVDYIFYFDIAALFILLITIITHFQHKHLPNMQNRVYLLFLVVAFVATSFDLLTTLMRGYGTSIHRNVYWIAHCFAFTTMNFLPLGYLIYCISLTKVVERTSAKKQIYMWISTIVPYFLQLILIWSTPLVSETKILAFSLDANNIYTRGDFWFYIIYAGTIYYIIYAVTILTIHKKELDRGIYFTVLSYIFMMVISVLLQLFFPNLLLLSFGISLAAIMFSTFIQNPKAYVDNVTELFNQDAFFSYTNGLYRRKQEFLCVSVVLDDTVFLSNNFGIDYLNQFTKAIADAFKNEKDFKNATSFYIRQGQYCLIWKNYGFRDVEKIIFNLRVLFNRTWTPENKRMKLYSSICVIECPQDAENVEALMKMVNLVAEDSKYKQGIVYGRNIDFENKLRSVDIEHSLRNALMENRFEVYYQPIYSTTEEMLIGAEALIRFRNSEQNLISPEEFIPVSERTGDILRIGEFVFDSVCKMLSLIDVEQYGIKKIDINLSVAQCMQDALADKFSSLRTIYGIPASIINLEITETAAAHTPDVLLKNMQKLSAEGMELSLDDYGSGYSNMNYLLTLPFKMVKIDKNIVWSAYGNLRTQTALSATIKMIHELGMTVLAEGVETQEQCEWLAQLGCDYLQGYYFSKPLKKEDFLDMMLKSVEEHSSELESMED